MMSSWRTIRTLYVPSAKGIQGFATYPLSRVIAFSERYRLQEKKEKKEKKKMFGPNVFGLFVGRVGGFFQEGRPDSRAWSRNALGGCQRAIHTIY